MTVTARPRRTPTARARRTCGAATAVLLGLTLAGPAAATTPAAASPAAASPAAASPTTAAATASPLSVGRLTLDHRVAPLGIDVGEAATPPRLSWELQARSGRGHVQSAYQVQVARSTAALGAGDADVWDSGRVASAESAQVAWAGPDLAPGTRYHWRVRVWDGAGSATAWSAPTWFETGLDAAGWSASWISPAPVEGRPAGGSYLRGVLDLPAGVRAADVASARLYVSGRGSYERGNDGEGICCEQQFGLARGIYEPWLNGRRVGDAQIESTSVDTRVRALYRTYDVADLLADGGNVLGLEIGEDSDVIAQLRVVTRDGRTLRLDTDGDWVSAPGPVQRAHRFHGESHDARAEIDGWSEPGQPAGAWAPVRVASAEAGRMDAAELEPMRVVSEHRPVEVTEPEPGVYVLDFGQNRSGWTQLSADLPAGTVVELVHGERLTDGRVDNAIIGARQTSRYVAAGGPVTWEPSFVYGGFRWVEVRGLPAAPGPDTVVAREVHNDVERTGRFVSSDPLLDRLHAANVQTQVNGLHQVPEDTPTREKRGWTADAHIAAEALINNLGMGALYANYSDEHVAAQRPDGRVPDIIPTEPTEAWTNRSDPAWGASHWLIPAYLHREYADPSLLVGHYDSLKSYVDYLATTVDDGLVTRPAHQWGQDWLAVESTDSRLFRSGFYHWALIEVARAADLAGRDDDAAELRERAAATAEAINAEFLDVRAGSYGESQFANAFPLTLGIVPEAQVDAVVQTLVDDVVDERGGHFTGGLPGIKYIPEALAMHGRSDVVLDVVRNNEYPGWGYMLENGPGTIWEDWRGASSLNHPMFSSIDDWLYSDVAGLQQAPDSVGYREAVVAPAVTDRLTRAGASIRTPYGRLASSFQRTAGSGLVQRVTVPVNTTATITVPVGDPLSVLDNGVPVAGRPGVLDVRRGEGGTEVTVGSGSYTLTSDSVVGALLAGGAETLEARRDVNGTGVSRLVVRSLRTSGAEAQRRLDLALTARRAGQSARARTLTVAALGHLQVLGRQVSDAQRQGRVSAAASWRIRTHIGRAQRHLSRVVSPGTGVSLALTASAEPALGDTVTVRAVVRNDGTQPLRDTSVSLRAPAGWRVERVGGPAKVLGAGRASAATFRVQVPITAATGPVELTAEVRTLRRGTRLSVPAALPVTVLSPARLVGLAARPRVIETDETTVRLQAALRNDSARSLDLDVGVEAPRGWSAGGLAPVRVPAGGSVPVEVEVERGDEAVAGGAFGLTLGAGGRVWSRGTTEAWVRGAGCADDATGEACLSSGTVLVASFETSTEGWTAGESIADVASVRTSANGPGVPRLGAGMLEASPVAEARIGDWRTVGVELAEPQAVGDARALVVSLNGYGGPSPSFTGRVRITGEQGASAEVEAQVEPDSWNELRLPLDEWDGGAITAIEVGYRGQGDGAWGGRFQVDRVVLDASPPPPAAADNLAAGRPVTARATLSCCGWSPGALVDGRRRSSSAVRGFTSDPPRSSRDAVEWVQVDLGERREVGEVWLWPRTALAGEPAGNGGAGFPTDFRVEVSDDGETWRTAGAFTGQLSDGLGGSGFAVDGAGRYLRLYVERLGVPAPDEAQGGLFRLQLAELEVYAPR